MGFAIIFEPLPPRSEFCTDELALLRLEDREERDEPGKDDPARPFG
jgi:hypothetical protein